MLVLVDVYIFWYALSRLAGFFVHVLEFTPYTICKDVDVRLVKLELHSFGQEVAMCKNLCLTTFGRVGIQFWHGSLWLPENDCHYQIQCN